MKHSIKYYYMPKSLPSIPLMYKGYIFRLSKNSNSDYIAKNTQTGDVISNITPDTIQEVKQTIDKRVSRRNEPVI